MEKIKNQVNAIVVYKGATFQELDQEYNDLGKRIEEGIEKMRHAGVFSEHEIEEVRKYANTVRNNRYNAAWSDVRGSIRSNFEF